ncbi:hypothetical protein BDF21DRAFT_432782 [Thamnidium elegans]|nr:hypothetical protein BDF21DRAFT_432782 [Thamnidium elegans]
MVSRGGLGHARVFLRLLLSSSSYLAPALMGFKTFMIRDSLPKQLNRESGRTLTVELILLSLRMIQKVRPPT